MLRSQDHARVRLLEFLQTIAVTSTSFENKEEESKGSFCLTSLVGRNEKGSRLPYFVLNIFFGTVFQPTASAKKLIPKAIFYLGI
jgi:hypothetical protein